ncbi:uncharacterized protein LODBEIA_P61120 [Lodderomyces beijingensis]|uniref:SEC7 domain-containing protein n=1 Tax=Lodderomyces beijingensis TaxID=1775926 RepID=A0ABP0ZUS1_9ASCO
MSLSRGPSQPSIRRSGSREEEKDNEKEAQEEEGVVPEKQKTVMEEEDSRQQEPMAGTKTEAEVETGVETGVETEAKAAPATPVASSTPIIDPTDAFAESTTNEAEQQEHISSKENASLQLAVALFQDKYALVTPAEITQFLAAGDDDAKQIRTYYMDLFEWSPNLLTSTRQLCAKLYMKAESQELDRILSSFTKSYLKQHPQNPFHTRNFEQIYIIIYSLILLNTALHNLELTKKSRISQNDFIRNTLTTFISQDNSSSKLTIKQRNEIEQELSLIYEDLLRERLYLKGTEENRHANCQVDESEETVTHLSNNSSEPKELELSRSSTSSSIWSSDSNLIKSSIAKRNTTATSQVTYLTASTQPMRPPQRVGMARALIGQQLQLQQQQHHHHQQESSKVYNTRSNRHSLSSQISTPSLRNRSSLDQLKSVVQKSSRASMISRRTCNELDDTISVFSFDTAKFEAGLGAEDSQCQEMEDFNVENYQDEYDLTLELNGSPYLKEGLLKLRVLNESQEEQATTTTITTSSTAAAAGPGHALTTNSRFRLFFSSSRGQQKASVGGTSINMLNHKFVEHFVVVSKGELSLYSFDPKVIKKHKKEHDYQGDVGDGNWLRNAANLGTYNLCSTFAQLDKSTNDKVYWSLTFPKISKKQPKKFIFEAGTKEIAMEFVNTCNFWASKITAIPASEESVSSLEYGWTNLDHLIKHRETFRKSKNIHKWEPMVKGVYLSNYVAKNDDTHHGMMNQFVKTSNYYTHLKKLYNEFVKLRQKFLDNLPRNYYGGSNYNRVLANYDAKMETYKFQLQVYRDYIIILGFALQLRFDLHEMKKKKQFFDQSLEDESLPNTSLESEEDDELTRMVKFEIQKLFFKMKDISNVIPTYEASESIKCLAQLSHSDHHKLVKSPKTFTLSNFRDTESPIAQLLATSNSNPGNPTGAAMMESTIVEEDECGNEDENPRRNKEEEGKKCKSEGQVDEEERGKVEERRSVSPGVASITKKHSLKPDLAVDTVDEVRAVIV